MVGLQEMAMSEREEYTQKCNSELHFHLKLEFDVGD
jgi:hypothetical protein